MALGCAEETCDEPPVGITDVDAHANVWGGGGARYPADHWGRGILGSYLDLSIGRTQRHTRASQQGWATAVRHRIKGTRARGLP